MADASLVGLLAVAGDGGAHFPPVDQDYLLQARQIQALSFMVHIPLVAFGISFPAMALFAEWRHLRTGDPLFRTLAQRWSKVMLALFAVDVVTGKILSCELGLLWPGFMASFANVFGLGFAMEAFPTSSRRSSSRSMSTAGTGSHHGCTSSAASPSRSPASPAHSSSSRSTAG
jgi:hypothetical protein